MTYYVYHDGPEPPYGPYAARRSALARQAKLRREGYETRLCADKHRLPTYVEWLLVAGAAVVGLAICWAIGI